MSKVRPGPRPRGPKGIKVLEHPDVEKPMDAPTIRQRKYMHNIVKGQSQREAMVNAGYSPKTTDPKVRTHHWAGVLRRSKLTDPVLGKRLHELVHAKSVKFFHGAARMTCCGQGAADCHCETKGQCEDRIIASPEFIDWQARAKGLDMALTIREAYGAKVETSPAAIAFEKDGDRLRIVVKWPENGQNA